MKIAGQNFEVYIDDVKIGDARDCTLNVSQSLFDSTSKDDDNFMTRGASFGEWSVDATVVFDETNSFDVVDALDLIIGATKVDIRFDGGSGTHWTGSAYVSNSSVNGPMADVATGTTTFTGDGELFERTWYLPNSLETDEMFTELKSEGVGGFADAGYWTSTEDTATNAFSRGFLTGNLVSSEKNSSIRIRPVRTFTAASGAYALRDTGPAGGLIFHVDGTTFYEAYPTDLTAQAWSNITATAVTGTGTAIGTGFANTLKIIAQTGHTASAAQSCYNL